MKYKIYILTKGRYDSLITADYLKNSGIDYWAHEEWIETIDKE